MCSNSARSRARGAPIQVSTAPSIDGAAPIRLIASIRGPRVGINAASGPACSPSRPRSDACRPRNAGPASRSLSIRTLSNVSAATPIVGATRVRARSSAVKWTRFTERSVPCVPHPDAAILPPRT